MKWRRCVLAMLGLLAVFVYEQAGDRLSDQGNALAAERKARDITAVLYMTDW